MDIRIRYSGLIIFFSRIVSTLTGLAYVIILTRSLSQPEYGAWNNIANVITSFGVFAVIFPGWAARFTARHFQGAMKLGILVNLLLSIPVAAMAIFLAPTFAAAAGTSAIFYVYASAIIAQQYLLISLDSVVAVVKTHVLGYAFLAFELIKLALVFPLVWILHFGIPGALLATFAASWAWIALYVYVLGDLWHEQMNRAYFRQWVKGVFLYLFGAGATLLSTLEGFILLFRGGNLTLAFYGAAGLLVVPIGYTTTLSTGLYPKLLAGGGSEDVETAWKVSLLFAIPLSLSIISLSPSLLAILNYTPAYIILSILVLRGFILTFGNIFDAMINGTERMDAKGYFTMKEALRSRIFKGLSTAYLTYPVYLPILWFALQPYVGNPLILGEVASLMGVLLTTVIISLKFFIARSALPVKFPLKSAAKFLLVSSVLVSITPFLPQPLPPLVTVAVFGTGAALYFAILYFLDDEARLLIRTAWQYGLGFFRYFGLIPERV